MLQLLQENQAGYVNLSKKDIQHITIIFIVRKSGCSRQEVFIFPLFLVLFLAPTCSLVFPIWYCEISILCGLVVILLLASGWSSHWFLMFCHKLIYFWCRLWGGCTWTRGEAIGDSIFTILVSCISTPNLTPSGSFRSPHLHQLDGGYIMVLMGKGRQ